MRLHLFVFIDDTSVVGVEAYSIETALSLSGSEGSLAYCRPAGYNGEVEQVVFHYRVTGIAVEKGWHDNSRRA